MFASGRFYANFYARLSPECNDRRRRLEKALGLRSSRVLELVLNEFEDRLLSRLSDAQHQQYLNGNLDKGVILKICAETRVAPPSSCSMTRQISSSQGSIRPSRSRGSDGP